MSTEENVNQEESVQQETVPAAEPVAAAAPSAGGNALSSFLSLKESNPKLFFGSVGGVAALLVLIIAMGGDDAAKPALKGQALKDLAIGQKYSLKE